MTEEAISRLAAQYLSDPRVSSGTGFGTKPGLRVDGHIFAMAVKGGLGVKLPAERAAALVAAGRATPMQTRPDRPMREWVVVADESLWQPLARESYAFVGATRPEE
jgi:hypothetical protein